MTATEDLLALGAPVHDRVLVARFIAQLALSSQQKAALLRGYLEEYRLSITTEVLIEARDYSFYL